MLIGETIVGLFISGLLGLFRTVLISAKKVAWRHHRLRKPSERF